MTQELETHAPGHLILIQVFSVKLNILKQTVPGSRLWGQSLEEFNRNSCLGLGGGSNGHLNAVG